MEQFNLQLRKLQNQHQKCDVMEYTCFSGVAEHHNQVGSICDLYSEGPWVKLWSEDGLSWLRFPIVLLIPSRHLSTPD